MGHVINSLKRNQEQLNFHSKSGLLPQGIPVFFLRFFGGNSGQVFGCFLFNSKSTGGDGLETLTNVGTAFHFNPAWLQGKEKDRQKLIVFVIFTRQFFQRIFLLVYTYTSDGLLNWLV